MRCAPIWAHLLFLSTRDGRSARDGPGPTGGCQGRSRGVGSKSLELARSRGMREENESGYQSRYSNWRTYKRSITLYTRPGLPYKEIAKYRSILGAGICKLRQYKAMVQECNTRLCLAMERTSAGWGMMLKGLGR